MKNQPKYARGKRIKRFIPQSRIENHLSKVKSLFKGESKLVNKINSNIEQANKLKNSSNALARFNIAILENDNQRYNNQLARIQNKRIELEKKLDQSLSINNQILSARKIY